MNHVLFQMIFYCNINDYLARESLSVLTATLLKQANNIFLSNITDQNTSVIKHFQQE